MINYMMCIIKQETKNAAAFFQSLHLSHGSSAGC